MSQISGSKGNFLYAIFEIPLASLYVNSLLGNLNIRQTLRHRDNVIDLDDIRSERVLPRSNASPRRSRNLVDLSGETAAGQSMVSLAVPSLFLFPLARPDNAALTCRSVHWLFILTLQLLPVVTRTPRTRYRRRVLHVFSGNVSMLMGPTIDRRSRGQMNNCWLVSCGIFCNIGVNIACSISIICNLEFISQTKNKLFHRHHVKGKEDAQDTATRFTMQ